MKRIIKDNVPEFWSDYLHEHPRSQYDELDDTENGRMLRKQVREHMLIQQKKICCYCCRQIDASDSHNEHIKPRSLFPMYSMDYNNLIVSCLSRDTCGMAKKDSYDQTTFISPLMEDCEMHFGFMTDGRIKGITSQGEKTIECLKLNTYALIQERKQQYKECCDMAKYMGKDYVFSEYIQEKDGQLHRFVDMIMYFYNRGDFDPEMCE